MIRADIHYSDYIVYVDESGDHSLDSINPRYPLFVLAFCVFNKSYYSHIATAALRMLKFTTFGHDMVVLHEHEIRKKYGAFNKLNRESRNYFLEQLTCLISNTDFTLLPIVIDKLALKEQGLDPLHIYHLAMRLGLEKLHEFLTHENQDKSLTHVIFESRGQKEDLELELEFRRDL